MSVGAEGGRFTSCAPSRGQFCTIVNKALGGYGPTAQKDVVAAGTTEVLVKSGVWFRCFSSDISSGLKVSDAALGVCGVRPPGEIPPPPGVSRHSRPSIPWEVQFRQTRCRMNTLKKALVHSALFGLESCPVAYHVHVCWPFPQGPRGRGPGGGSADPFNMAMDPYSPPSDDFLPISFKQNNMQKNRLKIREGSKSVDRNREKTV